MIRLEAAWRSVDARRRRQAFVVAVVISAVLLGVLLSFTSFSALGETLAGTDPAWVGGAVLATLLTYAIVALRLMLVLRLRGPAAMYNTTDVTVAHATLLILLPARLGDVCYPVLLRRSLGLNLTEAVVNLLALRVYDFLVAGALMLAAIAALRIEGEHGALILWGTIVAVAAGTAGVAVALLMLRTARQRRAEATGSGFMARLRRLAARVADAVHAFGRREHGVLLITTTLRWILSAGVVYCLLRSVTLDVGLVGALFVAMGLNFAVAMPLQTMAGIGLVEAAIAFLLSVLGVPVSAAVTSAVAMRVVWLTLLGVCTVAWFGLRRAIEPPAAARTDS